ncbi:MAG: hypothetical protein H0T73_14470 [Ardenticatenales bacterium]|nr:hypothetical protein [Ardenticatenales bacterium]
MPPHRPADLSLFFSILQTLEEIQAPYMMIGAFAATLYGLSRLTYDIDIVVDLSADHVETLAAAYPLPHYYADPQQMRDSIQMGILFNIIDTSRGEKADLVPLSMEPRYQEAFGRRIRQSLELPEGETLVVWCARPEDVILGKLLAWTEGRARRHETDIYEMVYNAAQQQQRGLTPLLQVDALAQDIAALGNEDVNHLWEAIQAQVQTALGGSTP